MSFYTQSFGGLVRCEACGAETRTVRGQILHQAVCHGIYLFTPEANRNEPDPVAAADLPTGLLWRERERVA